MIDHFKQHRPTPTNPSASQPHPTPNHPQLSRLFFLCFHPSPPTNRHAPHLRTIQASVDQTQNLPPKHFAINACNAYNARMLKTAPRTTTLTIRNIDPAVKERLRVRAARHGHSMEAELRAILAEAVQSEQAAQPNLAEAIRRRFAPLGGVELPQLPEIPIAPPPIFEP